MTGQSYLWGVLAAIGAGIAFNLGVLVEKIAVGRAGDAAGLGRLVRNRIWLAGFGLQFVVGIPLHLLAQAKIGPALIPGLMATGLVALALAASLAGEAVDRRDWVGIMIVIAGVACFGFSRLSVDMQAVPLYNDDFLTRLFLMTGLVAASSAASYVWQRRAVRSLGTLRSLNSGLMFAQSNLWLGILVGFWTRWGQGQFALLDLVGVAVSGAITVTGSVLGVAETQRAFQVGDAAKLVPIQSAPQQVLPLISYFAVFTLAPPSVLALPLAVAATLLVVAGSTLLARHQASVSGGPPRP